MEQKISKEIDIKQIYDSFKSDWKILLSIIIFFIIIGFSYQALKFDQYKSVAKLQIEQSNNSSILNNLNNSLGALSQFTGSLGGSERQENYVVEMLGSRILFESVISNGSLLPELVAAKGYDKETKEIIYNKNYNANEKEWSFDSDEDKKERLLFEKVFEKDYLSRLFVRLNRQTNFIEISFVHPSPEFAQKFLGIVISELDDLSRREALNTAEKSISYLERKLNESTQADLRTSIISLIEAQLKVIMYANTKEEYLIKFIDKPNLSYESDSPNRLLIMILSFIVGFIVSFCTLLVRVKMNHDYS